MPFLSSLMSRHCLVLWAVLQCGRHSPFIRVDIPAETPGRLRRGIARRHSGRFLTCYARKFMQITGFHGGEFLASRRRHKEAANLYEKAAELRPEDHELAVAAATAMRQAVRYQDAERWYRKAVSIKPTVSKTLLRGT
ncbi:hypothetical protein NQ318_009381 [Aromia moschata]|uniref:Tetratricopeptide repeat protein n=1 Tax=Aromia moschata TaxID=1265417 RepID=A0AAV8Z7Z2_9CUCU|nr:hypothetical protein NQ318_009381 [Aromia moschata]